MSENAWMNPAAQFEAASRMWLSAWLQPWSMLKVWQDYWRNQWLGGLDALAAAPAPVAPALLRGGVGSFGRGGADLTEVLTFFMPWLPRIEAVVSPEGPGESVRVRMRATAPAAEISGVAESMLVDAKITFASEPKPETLEASPPVAALEPEKGDAAPPPGPSGKAVAAGPKTRSTARRRKAPDGAPRGGEGKSS